MFPDIVRIISCVVLLLTFLVGLIGNSLLCLAVRNNLGMRTSTNLILVSLAVADILGCLVNMPIMFVTFVTDFMHDNIEVLGEIHFVLTVFIGFAICSCHVLLCVDRYDAIMSAFHRRITKTRIKRISIFVWGLSFSTALLTTALVIAVPTHWLTLAEDQPHFIAGEILNSAGTLVIFAVLFLMTYSSCVVRRGVRAHNTHMTNTLGRVTLVRELRITKVTSILVAGFTVTCLPWVIVRLLYSITGHQDKIAYMVSYSLLYTSHAINPVVYAGLIRNFQTAMKGELTKIISRLMCGITLGNMRSSFQVNISGEDTQRSTRSLAAIHPIAIANITAKNRAHSLPGETLNERD